MGHNLGMEHDCDGTCAYWSSSYVGPRQLDGVDCFGYMDYKDDTNYWSPCSVSDFSSYMNRQSNFCLEPLSGGESKSLTFYNIPIIYKIYYLNTCYTIMVIFIDRRDHHI